MQGVTLQRSHRQVLLAAGFHGVGLQLLHLLAAAQQGNASVVDSVDQVAAGGADVKFAFIFKILLRVRGVCSVMALFYQTCSFFP